MGSVKTAGFTRPFKLRLGVGNDGTGGSTGMLIDDVQAQVCTP